MSYVAIGRFVMGTRSITVVKDSNNNKIIEMYKQFDGYPSGLGAELQAFISTGTLVNGISDYENKAQFNGIACFAAALVDHFKEGPGGIYLQAPTADFKNKGKYSKIYDAEYYYEIDANLNLTCWDCYENKKVDLNAKD